MQITLIILHCALVVADNVEEIATNEVHDVTTVADAEVESAIDTAADEAFDNTIVELDVP